MYSGLSDIKLLAFCSAIKALRRNSVIYSHDRAYKLSPLLNIAPQTFNKYMAALDDLGLVRHTASGHRRIIALRECVRVLLPDLHTSKGNQAKHVLFFASFIKTPNVTEYYERIKYAIALHNFQQQRYNADKKIFALKDCPSYEVGRAYIQAYKKAKVSGRHQLKRALRLNTAIITGRNHIASKIGCSPSTGTRMLAKWHSQGKYTRTIIKQFFTHAVTHDDFDLLKAKHKGSNICISKDRSKFFIIKGSMIALPVSDVQEYNGYDLFKRKPKKDIKIQATS